MTTIDAGALRGDLAERILLTELDPIPASQRRTEEEVNTLFEQIRPAVLGARKDGTDSRDGQIRPHPRGPVCDRSTHPATSNDLNHPDKKYTHADHASCSMSRFVHSSEACRPRFGTPGNAVNKMITSRFLGLLVEPCDDPDLPVALFA